MNATDKRATREHPILFSGPMVRAILDGSKTQTRRVVTLRNSIRSACRRDWPYDLGRAWRDQGFGDGEYLHVPFCSPEDDWSHETAERWYCRWSVGDSLWVRECWWQRAEDGVIIFDVDGALSFDQTSLAHRMGIGNVPCPGDRDYARDGFRKRQSIHMPRWASRITLEITGVRVQRLQDITEEDAIAEGVDAVSMVDIPRQATLSRTSDFAQLWNRINGQRPGCDWQSNPWVWAVTFERRTVS